MTLEQRNTIDDATHDEWVAASQPMKMEISKEWCEKSAKIEGDAAVGAGLPSALGLPKLAAQPGALALGTGSNAVPSAEVNHLRSLLDDANGRIHIMQSMMSEAGFPMRIKLGEDLHGNEDWVRVRPECQLRDVLRRLAELTTKRQPEENQ